jgi:H+/Cl- antiporter ClcA
MGTMPTPYQQLWAVMLLALITGYLGSLFTSFNTWVCLVRKKWAKKMWARIAEVRRSLCVCVCVCVVGEGDVVRSTYLDTRQANAATGTFTCPVAVCQQLPYPPQLAHAMQVCAISVFTSLVFYALPLAGSCKACDLAGDPTHCIRGGAGCN